MQIPLAMTVIGPDRTGLVESVARADVRRDFVQGRRAIATARK
jgi:predicted amino acid-binding ACT domain protein